MLARGIARTDRVAAATVLAVQDDDDDGDDERSTDVEYGGGSRRRRSVFDWFWQRLRHSSVARFLRFAGALLLFSCLVAATTTATGTYLVWSGISHLRSGYIQTCTPIDNTSSASSGCDVTFTVLPPPSTHQTTTLLGTDTAEFVLLPVTRTERWYRPCTRIFHRDATTENDGHADPADPCVRAMEDGGTASGGVPLPGAWRICVHAARWPSWTWYSLCAPSSAAKRDDADAVATSLVPSDYMDSSRLAVAALLWLLGTDLAEHAARRVAPMHAAADPGPAWYRTMRFVIVGFWTCLVLPLLVFVY